MVESVSDRDASSEVRRQPHLLRAWDSSFSAYAQFVSEHGRRPNEHSPSLDERRLALWLRTQRKKVPGPTAEQIAKLDAHFPWWSNARTLESSEQYWLSRYNDYVAFFRENSRLPSTDVAAERALAVWVIRQDRARSGGRGLWTPSREAFFAEILRIRLTQKQERESAIAGRWKVRADDLGRFVHEHGRWPRQGSSDPIEHSLALWLGWQGDPGRAPKQLLAGLDRHAYLNEVAPGWRADQRPLGRSEGRADRRLLTPWKERADQLGRFTRESGRWPRWSADDPAERSLAIWRQHQRDRTRKQRPSAGGFDRTAYLDQVAPGWSTNQRSPAPWKARADQLGRFTRESGRWPRWSADDPAERSLAIWRQHQRDRTRKQRPSAGGFDRTAYLDQVAPGWSTNQRSPAPWKARADELGRFTRDYGRWPQQHAVDPTERSLAVWRQIQRKRALASEQITHESDRHAYLDQVAPGWSDSQMSAARWTARADELARFTRDHGRWPREDTPDLAERSLALWRQNQRNRVQGGRSTPSATDRRAYLDEVAPGWSATRMSPARWKERADELARFTGDHGRWPRRYTDDAAERSLALWRQNQRVRMESPSVDGFDRRAYLDRVAPGWAGEPREASVD